MKLLLVDGVDNTGKTRLIDRIKQLVPTVGVCSFPSKNLINTKIYWNVATNPTLENKNHWIVALIQDQYEILKSSFAKHDIILVDRLWYTSLVYQGDGPEKDWRYERYINAEYTAMMKRLNVTWESIQHILLFYPLCSSSDTETNKTKLVYDKKQKQLFNKQTQLLIQQDKYSHLKNEFFNNRIILAESQLSWYWLTHQWPPVEIISKIQETRARSIIRMYID